MNQDSTDLNAGHYVKNSSLQNGLAKEILSTFHFSKHAHILDVGCGDGRITAELANRAPQGVVLGIDPSPSMIEFASNSFPKTKFRNLGFQLGMVEDAVFSQKFDLIVSFSCFHWLRNPKKAISQLSASLKQGGEMLILTYPKESPYYRYLQTALKNYPDFLELSANNRMLSSEGYRDLLQQNQLQILEFQERRLVAFYKNHEEIKQYIKGWLNSYVPIPDDLSPGFLETVCQAIDHDPTTKTDGGIDLPYTALIIRARKL